MFLSPPPPYKLLIGILLCRYMKLTKYNVKRSAKRKRKENDFILKITKNNFVRTINTTVDLKLPSN